MSFVFEDDQIKPANPRASDALAAKNVTARLSKYKKWYQLTKQCIKSA